MAKCIGCMKNEGDPKNGGLCYVCAPPLKAVVGRIRRRFPPRR